MQGLCTSQLALLIVYFVSSSQHNRENRDWRSTLSVALVIRIYAFYSRAALFDARAAVDAFLLWTWQQSPLIDEFEYLCRCSQFVLFYVCQCLSLVCSLLFVLVRYWVVVVCTLTLHPSPHKTEHSGVKNVTLFVLCGRSVCLQCIYVNVSEYLSNLAYILVSYNVE